MNQISLFCFFRMLIFTPPDNDFAPLRLKPDQNAWNTGNRPYTRDDLPLNVNCSRPDLPRGFRNLFPDYLLEK